jgi:hypothetical protein
VDQIVAYCGIVCTDCSAYVATQADDQAALERVAAQWREEYGLVDITAESAICDGCLGSDGRRCYYCADCEIRVCGAERGVANCGHCADYVCGKPGRFFGLGFDPHARTRLDEIHGWLHATEGER